MKSILLKKAYLLTIFCVLTALFINAQTTYTYTGTGIWTDVPNWSPSYPGTTINTIDTVVIEGDITITIDIINNGTITNNGTLTNDFSGSITNDGSIANNETLITTGFIYNNGSMINNVSAILTTTSVGTIENDGAFENDGIINNYGFLTNDGFLTINETIDNGGLLINFSPGTLIITSLGYFSNDGSLESYGSINNSGTFFDDGGGIQNFGTLFGVNTGHVGPGVFSNQGILSPGNSPGTYTFNIDYRHRNSAILQIELESTTNFDLVAVSSTAYLDGTLDVSLLNGFSPNEGDTFTILTAGDIDGTFATTNLPSDYTWNVTYTDTEVILEVAETLSILDTEIKSFIMYPNPANIQFTVQLEASVELEHISVYNMLGQMVLTSEETIVNTSKLSTGSYIVEVTTNQTKSIKKLIIE